MGPFVQVVLGQIISLFGNAALRFVLCLWLIIICPRKQIIAYGHSALFGQ